MFYGILYNRDQEVKDTFDGAKRYMNSKVISLEEEITAGGKECYVLNLEGNPITYLWNKLRFGKYATFFRYK